MTAALRSHPQPADRITISGKQFRLAAPYIPPPDAPPLIGRERELRLLEAAYLPVPAGNGRCPLNVLLVGPPACGKTRLIEEYCRIAGRPLYIEQGHEGVSAEDLAVRARLTDDGERLIEYVLSPLATAMITENAVCLIDEFGKLPARTMAGLAAVADHRRMLDSPVAGVSIRARPGFRLAGTANGADFSSESLPQFIVERFGVRIDLALPDREALERILFGCFSAVREAASSFLGHFWKLWSRRTERLPSPRQFVDCCQFALQLARVDGRTRIERADVEEAIRVVLAA